MKLEMLHTLKDVSLGFGVVGFVYWQWTRSENYVWRADLPVPLRPSNWVFGVVWAVLFALLSACWLLPLYLGTPAENQTLYAVYIGILIAHVLLTKLWTVVAADLDSPTGALAVLVFVFVTGLCALVIAAFVGPWWMWLSFAFLAIYLVWCGFALYWNVWYMRAGESMVIRKRYTTLSDLETPISREHRYSGLKNARLAE